MRRSRAAGQVPVVPLPTYSAHLRQTQSRAAALTKGTREFHNNVHAQDKATFYSEELLNAFKRKTHELCDETREQYEHKLERQEAQHERQVHALQRQLREVVGSSVSLAETSSFLQRQRRSSSVTRGATRKQGEQEKADLMQRIEQLELLKSEAAVEVKERELSSCGGAKSSRLLAEERIDKTVQEVMKCKVAHAEFKGDMNTRVASLERELDHARRAVANEKSNTRALQRQQCSVAAKGAEHKQLQTEVEALRNALQTEKQAVKDATERLDKMQQRAAEAELQHQDLRHAFGPAAGDRGVIEAEGASPEAARRAVQGSRGEVVRQNKQLGEEASNRDASTEAWAKKLFGRQ
ncbi:hypothetical protein GQ600_22264 [Phytophthora cactorum]|nr:hypothetical protein GQ600_22264 [Phytophthora cactorum]